MKISEFKRQAFELGIVETDTGWYQGDRDILIKNSEIKDLDDLRDLVNLLIDKARETGKVEGEEAFKASIRSLVKGLIG